MTAFYIYYFTDNMYYLRNNAHLGSIKIDSIF